MKRNLSAIEIAEGALLADFAVIFHLLFVYLPVGGSVFRLLIPVVLAVLVLRRNLYVGIMSVCVAFFIASIVTGLPSSVPILFEGGAGLFFGITMKHRLHHLLLLLLGVTSGAITLFVLILLVAWVLGLPASTIVLPLHRSYDIFIAALGFVAKQVGLGNWWQYSAYPLITSLAQIAFTYWWTVFFTALWVTLWPIVLIMYFVTNLLVRWLGYDVHPFPGGWIEKLAKSTSKTLFKQSLRYRIKRRHAKG